MSKERLEEIKEDVFKCNHGDTRGYSYEQLYHIALSLVRIHGYWLIEQAELGISQQEQFHDYQTQNLRLQERVRKLENDKIVKLTKEEAEWLEKYRGSEGYVYDLMHDLPIKYDTNQDDLDLDRNMDNMLKMLTAFVKGYELLEGSE